MTPLIGTSGWHYKHWKGPFYPNEMPSDQYLAFYAERFKSVEINNSFYRLPQKAVLARWRDTVPSDFRFSVKASRFITHIKRLKDPRGPIGKFFRRVAILEDKLSCVLFQLPPRWGFQKDRLQKFLAAVPKITTYAFELRDPSWWNDETYELFDKYNIAFCIFELAGQTTPIQVTSKNVYLRFHGPTSAKYQGTYSDSQLKAWATRIRQWRRERRQVFCYFDNDQQAYAVDNALTLNEMLQRS
jgi:uncharacterized protein YecE (DUF72 family)